MQLRTQSLTQRWRKPEKLIETIGEPSRKLPNTHRDSEAIDERVRVLVELGYLVCAASGDLVVLDLALVRLAEAGKAD